MIIYKERKRKLIEKMVSSIGKVLFSPFGRALCMGLPALGVVSLGLLSSCLKKDDQTIGTISFAEGATRADIINNLRRRYCPIADLKKYADILASLNPTLSNEMPGARFSLRYIIPPCNDSLLPTLTIKPFSHPDRGISLPDTGKRPDTSPISPDARRSPDSFLTNDLVKRKHKKPRRPVIEPPKQPIQQPVLRPDLGTKRKPFVP